MELNKATQITKEFFKRRFPDKDIEFEKKVGYFDEWVARFQTGHPEGFMDIESLKIWKEMQEEELEEINAREEVLDKELNDRLLKEERMENAIDNQEEI